MNAERVPEIGPRMQTALDELKGIIRGRYPDAEFSVGPSPDDLAVVHLRTVVDVADKVTSIGPARTVGEVSKAEDEVSPVTGMLQAGEHPI